MIYNISYYSSGCSEDSSGAEEGSPLPDLSALDTIPEEDWDNLIASATQVNSLYSFSITVGTKNYLNC